LKLLRRLVSGDNVPVEQINHRAYLELAKAGLVEQVGSFVGEYSYRLTEEGLVRRAELLQP